MKGVRLVTKLKDTVLSGSIKVVGCSAGISFDSNMSYDFMTNVFNQLGVVSESDSSLIENTETGSLGAFGAVNSGNIKYKVMCGGTVNSVTSEANNKFKFKAGDVVTFCGIRDYNAELATIQNLVGIAMPIENIGVVIDVDTIVIEIYIEEV